jgi:glycosyltransferase involved in cell wall biosynthesis
MARVLVLANMYPPHHLGGYELSCQDVMTRLAGRGHEVAVLTTTTRFAGIADATDPRIPDVRRELRFYWDDHRLLDPPLRERLAIERHNQHRLRAALDDLRPDVVSVWNMGAMSLGLLTTIADRGIPMVYAVCDEWPVYAPRLDAWTRLFRDRPRWLGAAARAVTRLPVAPPDLGRTGAFCFVSDFARRRAEAAGWTFPRATVVYSGIERSEFPTPADAGRRPWRWRLLFVGRLDERKGLETLVRALALLPQEATLDVVGPGDAEFRARVDGLVADLGLGARVTFAEGPRSELAARFAAADVFVFPSEWEEPFGLVPVEAMACATPVVATGTGGSAEFLADGRNCLLVPPRDPEAVAAAVRRLAGDGDLRARLVAGGLATAGVLDTDRLADTFEAWHVAAAARFRDGVPADRELPLR